MFRAASKIKKLLREADMVGMPVAKTGMGFGNAFFAPPEVFKDPRMREQVFAMAPALSKMDPAKLETMGAIAYDPMYAKLGVLAHEVGHARSFHGKEGWLNQLATQHAAPLPGSGLLPLASAWYAGSTGKDLKALAVGAPLFAATRIPRLQSEHAATSYAKGRLGELLKNESEQLEVQERLLDRAFNTYRGGDAVDFASQYGGGRVLGSMLSKR